MKYKSELTHMESESQVGYHNHSNIILENAERDGRLLLHSEASSLARWQTLLEIRINTQPEDGRT